MIDQKQPQITKEETAKAKSKNFFVKIWTDSVFSKVIASSILLLLSILTAFIVKLFEGISIGDLFNQFLQIDIKLYLIILIAIILIIGYYVYLKFFNKRNLYKEEFLKQKVGNYRFGDLNNILLTTYVELPHSFRHKVGLKELDLLTLFKLFISQLNTVIGFDHPTEEGGFIYYNLGPKLISYGLCENIPSLNNNTAGNINTYDITTSKVGYEFFALLEIYERMENEQFYENEFYEKQKIKDEVLNKE